MLCSCLWMALAVTTKLGCCLRIQPRLLSEPPLGISIIPSYPLASRTPVPPTKGPMTAIFHDMMHREIEDDVDDTVVKSKARENHFHVLRRVFKRCRLYKLRINPLKCAFGVSARKFLGFLVHQWGINVDPSKAQAIATMKTPTTVNELKSFLGKLSYIQRFIPGLVALTTAFTPLLKKGRPYR